MKLTNRQQQRLQHALSLHESGQLDAAVAAYRGLLRLMPASTILLSNLGMALLQLGRRDEGLPLLERSVRIEPKQAAVWAACAMAYVEIGRGDGALDASHRALQIDPNNYAAHHAQGLARHMLGQYQLALAAYQKTLQIVPDHVEAFCNLGLTQIELGQIDQALNSFDQATKLAPFFLPAHVNRLRLLGRIGRCDEALQSCEKLIALMPSSHELRCEYASLLERARKLAAAYSEYKQVVAGDPSNTAAWYGLGRVAKELKQDDEAFAAYQRAFALDRGNSFLRSDFLGLSLESCNWRCYQSLLDGLSDVDLETGKALRPFETLRLPISAAHQLAAARYWLKTELSGAPAPRQFPKTLAGKNERKLRVGLVTSDLHDHPVAYLLENFLPLIPRQRIQLIGLPTSVSNVPMHRQRMFDEWFDISALDGEAAISRLIELELDLVLNLNGITKGERSELFATRVAPVQVSFLGYAGTLGADFIDYLIADRFVVPDEARNFYSEQIAYLPDTFFVPNIPEHLEIEISRTDEGLPENGMVFCCFNNSYKITPDIFDIWMRLLLQAPESVLWLSGSNQTVVSNLRREAELRGVAADRLVFARFRESRTEHLSRLRLADLFLDTFYYNAHTTASDALWAGVPVLTCPGETFASRVAGSLLKAAGMDDLIVESREAYEAKALQLARDPELLAETRARLARNRETCPIFDMPRYARNFERLLLAMWHRHEQGLPPGPIELVQE